MPGEEIGGTNYVDHPQMDQQGGTQVGGWNRAGGRGGEALLYGDWSSTQYATNQNWVLSHYCYRNVPLGLHYPWHKYEDNKDNIGGIAGTRPIVSARVLQPLFRTSKELAGRALVVMYDGRTILDRYANGGAPARRQLLASGSKSFVGVAAAAAVEDKVLRLDDPASEAITEWKHHPAKLKITYRQLLSLTSGLKPTERGAALRAPAWKDIAGKPMTGKPGEQFTYGAYHLNAFAYALERRLGKESFEAYLKRRVLDPIGVEVECRIRCADGRPQVGGGAFMTARDWAKFGEFIRLRGRWQDKQIVDPGILGHLFRGSEQNPAYGLTWWLKAPVSGDLCRRVPVLSRQWAAVANSTWIPKDLVAACGAGKQRLYVIPSRKLVVARQGALARRFSDAAFLRKLLGRDAVE